MVIRNYHWLNSASRVLITTCSAPLAQGRPHAKIKVKGQMVQTVERPQTNGRTHTHTHGRYQTRSITTVHKQLKRILRLFNKQAINDIFFKTKLLA